MKVVIFTTCKPFIGDDAWRQEQAIKSWLELTGIEKKIVIIGNDKGTKEICEKYNLVHHPGVKIFNGVPYVYDMLMQGASYADEEDYLIWTNCDMIYFQDMFDNIIEFDNYRKEKKLEKFILVGQRHDWFNPKLLDNFKKEEIMKNINLNNTRSTLICKENSPKIEISLHLSCGIDYIIHSKNTYKDAFNPNYVICGTMHDMILVGSVIKRGLYNCDISNSNFCLHQNHDNFKGKEKLVKKLRNNNMSLNERKLMASINNTNFKSCKEKGKLIFLKK